MGHALGYAHICAYAVIACLHLPARWGVLRFAACGKKACRRGCVKNHKFVAVPLVGRCAPAPPQLDKGPGVCVVISALACSYVGLCALRSLLLALAGYAPPRSMPGAIFAFLAHSRLFSPVCSFCTQQWMPVRRYCAFSVKKVRLPVTFTGIWVSGRCYLGPCPCCCHCPDQAD